MKTKTAKTEKEFMVRVLVVPPNYQIQLGAATVHYETRTVKGYTLKDAKEKAGVQ